MQPTTWLDARGEMRAVSLFRIVAGPLVVLHLWPFLSDAYRGHYYRDSFYVPWFQHYPELPLPAYRALLVIAAVAAAALSCGYHSRLASWVCSGVVAYNFFLSETFFHHNRTFLLVFLGGLSITHGGDSLSWDARRRGGCGQHGQPAPQRALWPLWLWRAEACAPYLASSISKLLDPDWFAGIVTWDRVERHRHLAAHIVPAPLLDIAADPHVHVWLAKLVIALELSVGVGLWFGRTRYLAVWLAVLFHVLVQMSARIQVFSVLGIAGLLIWTTPHTRERTLALRLDHALGRRIAFWVRRLDWLARFDVVAVEVGETVTLFTRDQRQLTGRRAILHVFARLPLTTVFVMPLIGFDLAR